MQTSQSVAGDGVENGDGKKAETRSDENCVKHPVHSLGSATNGKFHI
jgi:hypothetical protein